MNRVSFGFALRRSWRSALILSAVLAAFVWMTLAVSAGFLSDFQGVPLFANPPRAMRAFLGGAGSFISPDGWLASAYLHPIVLSMSSVGALLVAAGSGATELENGTLDLVLSRPVGRGRHLMGRLAAGVALSTIVQAGALAGALIGYATLPEMRELTLTRVATTCLGAALLYALFACAGMWAFAAARQRSRALGWSIGIITASYLVNFVALAFETTSFLGPLTPFRYFRAGELLSGASPIGTFTVLPALAIGCALAAHQTFERRDLAR